MQKKWRQIIGIWLVSLLVKPAVVCSYEVISVRDGGSITGVVTYQGPRPTAEVLSISKDQEVCGKTEKVSESLIVGANQGVQHAVVSLGNMQKGKRPVRKSVTLDQKGCRYTPHVLLVPAGAEMAILNNDGILHNFRSHSQTNPPINKAQPKFKKMMKEKFAAPEIIKVTCDAHAWMSGWLVITEHPYYAVTDAKGSFQLTDIPPGEYDLHVWHELLKGTAQNVRVLSHTPQVVMIELWKP